MKMIKTITTIALITMLTGCTINQPKQEVYINYECIKNELYRVTPKSSEALRDTDGNKLDCNYTTVF